MPRNDLWEGIAARLGVTVSLLFLGLPKSPEDYDFIAKYADEIEGADLLLARRPLASSIDYDRLRKGDKGHRAEEGPQDNMGRVASRIPQQRAPSTRQDCEAYVRQLLDAAEMSEDPNAWPVIHDRLKKQFPLAEWEAPPQGD